MAAVLDSLENQVRSKLGDQLWRLSNLYYITDKNGKKVKFKPNWAQQKLLDEMWYQNIILKARQLGFTTFIQIYFLDVCLFNSNVRAGVIAHNQDDAKVFFRDKIKYAYDNLPDWLKRQIPARNDSAGELVFVNNSSIRVGTSMRSGTLQYLHVSEFGKVCAKYPEKAKEIVTGALNAVQAGQFVFIESTAEGRDGYFFKYCQEARHHQEQGSHLTPLDKKFHFFPWWECPDYKLDPKGVVVTREYVDYFQYLEDKFGIKLNARQKAWYVKKAQDQGDDMKREFPSTPDEAFEASIEGAYYQKQMQQVRKNGQITNIPYDPRLPVYTFWDLGRNDSTAIWFMQYFNSQYRFIRYYENSGENIQFYINYLRTLNYTYGTVYMPHDAEVVDLTQADNKSRRQIVVESGLPVEIVPRTPDKLEAIQAVRDVLPLCWFDEEHCDQGIKCLDHFRKMWDDKLGAYKDRPLHDWASHGNDAFEQMARGFTVYQGAESYEPDWEV